MLKLWIKSKIKSYPQARRTARVEKYNIQILGNTYIPVDKKVIHKNLPLWWVTSNLPRIATTRRCGCG